MNLKNAIISCLRSSAFLSFFVTWYQGAICVHRNFFNTENKYVYYLAGLVASLGLLVEKKSRRSELALYALPRGLDSFYMILCDRKFLKAVPYGELILYCLSLAGIMYFYDNEKSNMTPILAWGLKKLLGEDENSKEKKKNKQKLETSNETNTNNNHNNQTNTNNQNEEKEEIRNKEEKSNLN